MFPIRDTQPSNSRPVVTILIIIVNILVFLFEFSLDEYSRNHFITVYGLVPARFHLSALFTHMFLHGSWMHIIGNMWFLWIFGDNVEDVMGHGKYLAFYLACGVLAALTQLWFNSDSQVPMVGASGAIAGVMGAFLVKFPHARIVTVLFVGLLFWFELPAVVILLYWFAIQLFSGFGSIGYSHVSQGGTAFFAHVGGFIAGMILVMVVGTQPRYSRRADLNW
jgi:membrane associated rhomboid family serine protease